MANNITFLSNNEICNAFLDLEFIIKVNNQETKVSFVKEKDNPTINNYSIVQIEDGIFNLLFIYNNKTYSVNIDLHKSIVLISSLTATGNFLQTKGIVNIQNPHKPITNEEKAADFWLRFFDKHDESAIDDYLAPPYIQHNPQVSDGVEAFRNEFHERFKTNMKECNTQIKK